MQRKTIILFPLILFIFSTATFISCRLFTAYLEENPKAFKIAKMDRIDLAMQQEVELTKDPALNRVPRERLAEAERIRVAKLRELPSRTTGAVPGISWQERGPINVGGRSRAVLYDLSDAPNYRKVWAGSVGGGLWYTNDISAASPVWNLVDDFMGNLAITSIVQDPSNNQVMYAGTGEGWFNLDAIQGLGIWKSTNGGTSWSQLASTNNSTFYHIQKLIVTSAGTVLACTRAGGVQRSTDGGNTWTKVLGNGIAGATTDRAADIEIAANGYLYATLGIFNVGGIYRSTDGGVSWTNIYASASDEERIEIACAPSNQEIIYALVQDNNGPNTDGIKKIMSTSDATAPVPTWTTLTTPSWCDQGSASTDFTRGQAWYDLIAAVDPSDANTVYIGGVDILKSTNGGTTWTQISRWSSFGGCSGTYVHADIHALVFRPGSTSELTVGCDGGIFRTTDGGASFAEKNSGYNVTQYYACAIHPSSTNYFLAGAQDNGTQKFTTAGLNTTTNASGGDGAFCHIDQDNGNIQITSYVYNNYYVSTNGGTSFTSYSKNNNGQFINPTDYDDAANILYAGNTAGSYFRWLDPATNGASTSVTVTEFAGSSITHVAVSPLTSNRVYFGLANGDVVLVDNANTATSPATGSIIRSGTGSVSCVAIDPANEDHMLVTYSNYGVTSIFESFNATQASPTWTAVEGDLPDMPVRWAMFDPRNSDWALLATELGVWSTDNIDGASTDWEPTSTGLANVRIDMLQYRSSDRTVAAATHGRGLFTAIIPSVLTPDISFATGSASAAEQTVSSVSCRGYRDYSVNMIIANAPTGDATITVSVQGGATATQGTDYDFTTNADFTSPSNTFVFTSGSTTPKPIHIRIYDDAEVESSQSFTLTYSISGTTNAQAGASNQTYTFTINDNDAAPSATSTVNASIGLANTGLSQPFRGQYTDARTQMVFLASELTAAGFSAGNITSLSFNITTKSSTAPYNGLTIRMSNTSTSTMTGGTFEGGTTTVYGPVNYSTTAGINTFTLSTPFAWDGTSNLLIEICYDNATGTASDLVAGTSATPRCHFDRVDGATGCSLPTANFQFAGGGARPDISLSITVPGTTVASALNTSKTNSLSGNADLYFYSSSGEIMARVRNLTAHDYGCTQVIIDRAGTASTQFWNTNTANYLMDKTFRIIPTTNNGAGQYEVTLYFTQAEVQGWEAATGQLWNNIQMVKIPSQISNVTPATPEPDGSGTVQVVSPTLGTLGTNYTMTYTFTNGFSGFGAGIPGSPPTLPVSLLNFTGRLQKNNVLLGWSTSYEHNNRGFEIEKSYDGVSFRKIGFVASGGNSNAIRNYSFIDKESAVQFNYYRLRMVDFDNTAKLSEVILVKNTQAVQQVRVINNPFSTYIDLRFDRLPAGRVNIQLNDVNGRKIAETEYSNIQQATLRFDLSMGYLSRGVYILSVEADRQRYTQKVVRQ